LYLIQVIIKNKNPKKKKLYALYKQVSQGNVDTQRPGLFDVVGRAKWYESMMN
jgi:diazepam-binding inhibitor (GABA receptor modulating acyl-CoA-binding protein)